MNDRTQQAERRKLLVPFDVATAEGGQRLGYLADLSATGLMFVTEHVFAEGEQLTLCIEVPEEQQSLDHLVTEVEVIWTRPNINPELACVGCRFTAVGGDDIRRLVAISREYAFDPDLEIRRVPDTD